MGMDCPICNSRQPMLAAVTADGTPAKKTDDILAYRLACGHTVGGEQYNKFLEESRKIDRAAFDAIRAARDVAASEKAALWKSLTDSTKEH